MIVNLYNVDKKYNVIYADPPWFYRNQNTGGSMTSGAINHYPTMTLDELKKLPIPAQKDCVLFLWATTPLLPEALEIMREWGFKYKTAMVWVKTGRLGMGFWFRINTEFLLVGIKGRVRPFKMAERNFILRKPLAHSEKPEEFRDIINQVSEGIFDNPQKIELFARKESEGWDSWGNELEENI